MKQTYYLYWYRLKEHNDIATQGYVGITNRPSRRCREHKSNINAGVQSHFYNAARKYGTDNIVYSIEAKGDFEHINNLEKQYRPSKNIGWNAAIGGVDALHTWFKKPVTLFHIDEPNKEYSFNSHTEAAEALGVNIARITQAVRRNNKHYGLDGWAIKVAGTVDKAKLHSYGQRKSMQVKGIKRDKPSHFKGLTNRWSEEDRARIGKHHKGKKIPAKQVEAMRERNRHNSYCVKIVLSHISNMDKHYVFHSISEASRQLGIPLSRLKSKAQRPLRAYGKDGWAIIERGSE